MSTFLKNKLNTVKHFSGVSIETGGWDVFFCLGVRDYIYTVYILMKMKINLHYSYESAPETRKNLKYAFRRSFREQLQWIYLQILLSEIMRLPRGCLFFMDGHFVYTEYGLCIISSTWCSITDCQNADAAAQGVVYCPWCDWEPDPLCAGTDTVLSTNGCLN